MDARQHRLGETFSDWGIPTADCIRQVRGVSKSIPLIASGGLRSGLDAAKCVALGADLAGFALPFLQAANESEDALKTLTEILIDEMKTVLFCTGNSDLESLVRSQSLQVIPLIPPSLGLERSTIAPRSQSRTYSP